jgi:hypothetical protein
LQEGPAEGQKPSNRRIAHSVLMALGWVFSRLESFSPFDEDVYDPSRMKKFSEFALMLAVYVGLTGNRESGGVRRGIELVQDACGRADFSDWTMRAPAAIVNYAELCAVIIELGGDAQDLRLKVQSAVDAAAVSHIERVPYRLLEMRVALDWAGIKHSLPSARDLYSDTILGRPLLTPMLASEGIYAITHVILFGSRFGLTQSSLPASLQPGRIRAVLCDLLVVTCQESNWDLLGELLLCWDCMGFEPSPLTSAAWASFLGAFRADGSVPPHPLNVKPKTPPSGTTDSSEDGVSDFGTVYHTTLVAILAGSVRLSRSAHVNLIDGSKLEGRLVDR